MNRFLPMVPVHFFVRGKMKELKQHVVVSREGAVKTDRDEFSVGSLGTPLTVSLKYSLHDAEKHVKHGHGKIQLLDVPSVFGAAVIRKSYNPFDNESSFEIETNEFQSRYVLIVEQPVKVWLHSTHLVTAGSRLVIEGPERKTPKLNLMPTAILDKPLLLAPDKPKQEFQLIVDPFGGQSLIRTARLTMRYADSRETGELMIIPHVANLTGSGRILSDGTGAVFVVAGLKPERNYKLELDADGERVLTWQATTKTGLVYDVLRDP